MSSSGSEVCWALIVLLSMIVSPTYCTNGKPEPSEQRYLKASLFSRVPPYLQFQSIFEKPVNIPSKIKSKLLWPESEPGPRKVLHDGTLRASGITLVSKKESSCQSCGQLSFLGWFRKPSGRLGKNFQKVNSFPSMGKELSYKDGLFNNLNKFNQKHPRTPMPFLIPSFVLPDEMDAFKKAWVKTENKLWISKRPYSSFSRNIKMLTHWQDFDQGRDRRSLVQKYIQNPMLHDNLKTEVKYVFLVTSVHPLRIYSLPGSLLISWADSNYTADPTRIHDTCIHLRLADSGRNKCDRPDFMADHTDTQYHDFYLQVNSKYNIEKLLHGMDQAVLLSLLSAEKSLTRAFYRSAKNRNDFFQLMGADFVVDEHGTPWLMEINASPMRAIEPRFSCQNYHLKDFYSDALNIAGFHLPPTIETSAQQLIKSDHRFANLTKVVLDQNETLYAMKLSEDEARKQSEFRNLNERHSYLSSILQNLTRDDVRLLMIAEDELYRARIARRLFPKPSMGNYLQYVESDKYYYKLLDAWETRYGDDRSAGRKLLETLSQEFL